MPISKTVKSPTQVDVSYHEVFKMEVSGDFNAASLFLKSYATQQDALDGRPLAWMWEISAPVSIFDNKISIPSVEQALVQTPGTPFFGGQILTSETPLEAARRIKRMEIATARDRHELGGFTWNSYTFDSDMVSQQRLNQACQQALLANMTNSSFSRNWTLSNGEVLENVTAEQMLEICSALANYVNNLHTKSKELYKKIDLATTLEEVAAVTWS